MKRALTFFKLLFLFLCLAQALLFFVPLADQSAFAALNGNAGDMSGGTVSCFSALSLISDEVKILLLMFLILPLLMAVMALPCFNFVFGLEPVLLICMFVLRYASSNLFGGAKLAESLFGMMTTFIGMVLIPVWLVHALIKFVYLISGSADNDRSERLRREYERMTGIGRVNKRRCPECGETIAMEAKFCRRCGTDLSEEDEE